MSMLLKREETSLVNNWMGNRVVWSNRPSCSGMSCCVGSTLVCKTLSFHLPEMSCITTTMRNQRHFSPFPTMFVCLWFFLPFAESLSSCFPLLLSELTSPTAWVIYTAVNEEKKIIHSQTTNTQIFLQMHKAPKYVQE